VTMCRDWLMVTQHRVTMPPGATRGYAHS